MLVLPSQLYEEGVLVFALMFKICVYHVFLFVCSFYCSWGVLDVLRTTTYGSDLTSRLAAVSRLDLLYVSENRGFGIL